jgi:hypothetical protein
LLYQILFHITPGISDLNQIFQRRSCNISDIPGVRCLEVRYSWELDSPTDSLPPAYKILSQSGSNTLQSNREAHMSSLMIQGVRKQEPTKVQIGADIEIITKFEAGERVFYLQIVEPQSPLLEEYVADMMGMS